MATKATAKIASDDEAQDAVEETKSSRALECTRNYALGAAGAGFAIPFPLGDLIAISAIQLKMLHAISRIYGLKMSDNVGKSLIASLLGAGLSDWLGRGLLASLSKSIPLIGSVAGMLSLPAVAGASTYAVGKVFVQHFESGGTFLDFEPAKVKAHFASYFQEGQTVVADAEK